MAKQKEVNAAAHAINTNSDRWNSLYNSGLLDRPFGEYSAESSENVHPDDIISWVNDVINKGRK